MLINSYLYHTQFKKMASAQQLDTIVDNSTAVTVQTALRNIFAKFRGQITLFANGTVVGKANAQLDQLSLPVPGWNGDNSQSHLDVYYPNCPVYIKNFTQMEPEVWVILIGDKYADYAEAHQASLGIMAKDFTQRQVL